MEKRRLGRTGFEVSVIGMGGIPIQRVTKDEAISIVEEAHKQGINFIDTAIGYNESETLLGEALKIVGREKFYLATKSMNRTKDIIDDLNKSLKDLQTDYIDLYQFHNVSSEEEFETLMGEDGAYNVVKKLQEEGIIKEIGVSSHSLDMLEKMVETDYFSTIQYPYNPAELQGEKVFARAKERDIGVIVMKPLAGGAIMKGELCLRFIMENENVTLAIPGMDNVEQVQENANVGVNYRPLTDSEREELENEIATLDHHFCRRCGYCGPCTVGINIPFQFILEGYYSRYDLKDWSKNRYEGLEVNASDCIKCGQCEPRCPYNLPIMEMLDKVENIFG